MSNQGDVEEDNECNMNLKPDTLQNCDMGACARSWFTSHWSERVIQCVIQHIYSVTYTKTMMHSRKCEIMFKRA